MRGLPREAAGLVGCLRGRAGKIWTPSTMFLGCSRWDSASMYEFGVGSLTLWACNGCVCQLQSE